MPRFNPLEPRLHIADFQRSVRFYRDVLGFAVLAQFPEDEPSFALLARDGVGPYIGGPEAAKDERSPATVTSTSTSGTRSRCTTRRSSR